MSTEIQKKMRISQKSESNYSKNVNRRDFMKLSGASLASAALLSACKPILNTINYIYEQTQTPLPSSPAIPSNTPGSLETPLQPENTPIQPLETPKVEFTETPVPTSTEIPPEICTLNSRQMAEKLFSEGLKDECEGKPLVTEEKTKQFLGNEQAYSELNQSVVSMVDSMVKRGEKNFIVPMFAINSLSSYTSDPLRSFFYENADQNGNIFISTSNGYELPRPSGYMQIFSKGFAEGGWMTMFKGKDGLLRVVLPAGEKVIDKWLSTPLGDVDTYILKAQQAFGVLKCVKLGNCNWTAVQTKRSEPNHVMAVLNREASVDSDPSSIWFNNPENANDYPDKWMYEGPIGYNPAYLLSGEEIKVNPEMTANYHKEFLKGLWNFNNLAENTNYLKANYGIKNEEEFITSALDGVNFKNLVLPYGIVDKQTKYRLLKADKHQEKINLSKILIRVLHREQLKTMYPDINSPENKGTFFLNDTGSGVVFMEVVKDEKDVNRIQLTFGSYNDHIVIERNWLAIDVPDVDNLEAVNQLTALLNYRLQRIWGKYGDIYTISNVPLDNETCEYYKNNENLFIR